ncbi:MAG: type IV pilus modification PilV family protein [Longimicrobiales bacterium]
MTAKGARGDRGGFALAMVVFLLFAVAVAGATGYQVVSSEFALARQNRDGQQALAVARAGMSRYLGESVGSVADTVLYAIGNGVATVTAKRVLMQDSLSYLYYIESTGEVDDIRTPLLPARRTVGTYAWHRLSPIRLKGAVWVSGGTTTLGGSGGFFGIPASVSGDDDATLSDCSGGGTAGVRGVVKGSGGVSVGSGASLTGPAPTTLTYTGYESMYDTVGVRWDILSSASFPVDFDGSPPNWGSIPADSFPIVRYRGNLNLTSSWSGRGVLIVTGTVSCSTWFASFHWDGIVLAGALGGTWNQSCMPNVDGMLIGGLNAANPSVTLRGDYRYHSCNAYKANRSLSYLEVVDNTLFEVNR